MKHYLSFKTELDPNNVTRTKFKRYCGTARFVYNWGLLDRKNNDKIVSLFSQQRKLTALKKNGAFAWLYEISKSVPRRALFNLDQAFKNFYARRSNFPKLKKKGRCKDVFTLENNKIYFIKHGIVLPGIGYVRMKEFCAVPGNILSATISRTADRWYISINLEREIAANDDLVQHVTGVDFGVKSFITLSNGKKYESPHALIRSLKTLARVHRKHIRKKKGSKNRKKAQLKVAKIYQHITNQRKDFLHKLSTKLAKTKSVFVLEDLSMGNMLNNKYLARNISDQGWYTFTKYLRYKADWYGSIVFYAEKYTPSTRTCSNCGYIRKKLDLRQRFWSCPCCQTDHDRDINAAKNLRKIFFRSYREFLGNVTPVEISKRKSGKQEADTG